MMPDTIKHCKGPVKKYTNSYHLANFIVCMNNLSTPIGLAYRETDSN